MFRWTAPTALAGALFVAACAGPAIEDYAGTEPDFVLEDYFTGAPVTARGVFIDRFGTLRRHFTVAIEGRWDGEALTLVEDFEYNDGEVDQRIWTLRKTGPNSYVGTAPDVEGEAMVESAGNATTLSYEIDLPVGEDVWRVSFEDWLWQLDEDTVFNRAVVRRWGFEIGQVLIYFERQPEG